MKGAGPPEQYGVLVDQQILTQVRYPTMYQSNKAHTSHPVSFIRYFSYCFFCVRLAAKKTACGTSVWNREGKTLLMWRQHPSVCTYYFIGDCTV